MALVGKIRRMYLRDKMSFSEIARRTSLSRNTVKKWLKVPEAAPPKYRRRDTPGKLSAFEAQLVQVTWKRTLTVRSETVELRVRCARSSGVRATGAATRG